MRRREERCKDGYFVEISERTGILSKNGTFGKLNDYLVGNESFLVKENYDDFIGSEVLYTIVYHKKYTKSGKERFFYTYDFKKLYIF